MSGAWTFAPGAWDERIRELDGAFVFQSSGWAEHRRATGWVPERWWYEGADGRCAVQLLLRRRLGVTLAWAPGGPLFDRSAVPAGALPALFAALPRRHGPVYVRCDPPVPPGSPAEAALARAASRPAVRLNTGLTVVVDAHEDGGTLLGRMSKHHRYEVRRALTRGIAWRTGRGPGELDALAALHRAMAGRKRIAVAPQARRDVIASLCARFGDDAFILVGSHEAQDVTACFVIVFGDRALFHTAATAGEGLRTGVSYAAVYETLRVLARRGVRELDLGGLDTRAAMSGVAHFKQGFGGEVSERTGEWEWASRPLVAAVVNAALALRRGIVQA